MKNWCGHCDALVVRRWGLCSPCSAYKVKYGRLPAFDVLARRQARLDEKRFTRR